MDCNLRFKSNLSVIYVPSNGTVCLWVVFQSIFTPSSSVLMFAETLLPRLWAFFPGFDQGLVGIWCLHAKVLDIHIPADMMNTNILVFWAPHLVCAGACHVYLFILQPKPFFFNARKMRPLWHIAGLSLLNVSIVTQIRLICLILSNGRRERHQIINTSSHLWLVSGCHRVRTRGAMVEDRRDSRDTVIIMEFNRYYIKIIHTVHSILYILAASVRG